ncbi:MAG TPA: hypothetical protein VIL92_06235 [Gaiellaceae bacterium]
MPGQPVGAVHVNVPLSNLARLYRPLDSGFIADEVAPYLDVVHESDLYYTFTQGDFYGTDVTDLTPDRTEPRAIEFSHSTAQYRCARRELAWDISDRERGNADNQLRLERNKQVGTLGRLGLLREMRVEAILQINTTTTTVAGEAIVGGLDSGNTAAKTGFWDGAAVTYNSIFTDVVKGITKIRQTIGLRPNVIVIPAAVAEGLHKSLFFSGLQQYTRGDVAAQPLYEQYPLLPQILWGLRVLVPGVIKNAAVEGQTESYSDIWGETVRLLYVQPGPAIETPSCLYTFRSEPFNTRQSRDDKKRIDWFAAGQTIQEAVVAPFAGYTITDCLT